MSALGEMGETACHSFTVHYGLSYMITPSIVLWHPRHPRNVGSTLRAAACFGIKQVWCIDSRIKLNPRHLKYHHPGKFRNRTIQPTQLVMEDEQMLYEPGLHLVGVELVERSIPLSVFKHPKEAVYVFGPEDGSIPKHVLEECKDVVEITSNFCLNLAAAANVVLYDRSTKQ